MIMELHNLIPFSIYIITSFLFLFLFIKLVKRSSSNNSTANLPPGPWSLPLIGNIHHILGSIPHHRFKKLADKYGPLMHLKLGEVSNIIVTSPEIAKEILKTNGLNFSDRPNLVLARIITYNATDIGASPYGDYWRQLRKICTVELLTTKRVQSFRSIREEEVSEVVKEIASREGSVVNLSQLISSMTYGIMACATFGRKNRHQKAFISAIEEMVKLVGGFCVADLYPSIKVLQLMSTEKAKLEKVHREIDRIYEDIIDDHKNRSSQSSECEETREDLVDVLLKFQQGKDLQYPLTDNNIKAVIHDMFSAGSETSIRVVEWGMSEMVKNPKVMEEAQNEVRRVFDNKGYVDETGLHQLLYLKSIIKETLRLHPSAPLLLPRENREKCEINGYEIPAKTKVIINAWAIGRDPKYWTEPENFKPERFLNSTIDFRGKNFEYIPFGAGRRICPGIEFAIPNIELALAQLLYNFDWKLPNGMKNEELDMTETFGLTVKREKDLCMIPIICRHSVLSM